MGTLRFAGDFPPFVVAAIAIVAALVVMVLYFRESRSLAAPYSYLLPGLRAAAVVLVILILAGPVLHKRTVVGTLGRVVFAVDQSESMAISDSAGSDSTTPRLERALRLLSGDGDSPGWLETLRNTHEVDVVAFSDGDPSMLWTNRTEDSQPNSFELLADGQRTDLSTTLMTMLSSLTAGEIEPPNASADGIQRAAIVLMTDGRHNSGPSPVEYAEQLESAGVGVHAIGLGSEDEPADIGIVQVDRPDTVASDGRLSGSLLLKQFGVEGKEVNVRIESAGKTVWQKTVTAGSGQMSIPFEMEVEPIVEQLNGDIPRGVRRSSIVMDLRAVVDAPESDHSAQNNNLAFRVAASTRDRRLLILDGSSRWETRYIKNLFERDPSWRVDTVLFGPGTDMRILDRGDQPGQYPNSFESMSVYDAVILGEVPPDQFNEEDSLLLAEFVRRGGGLIVVDGRYDRVRQLAEASLGELIPVDYLTQDAPLEVRSVRPTQMGIDHPVMNLWGDKEKLEAQWEDLPSPAVAIRVRAQEGTEIWADAVGKDGRESPWMVTRLYGAGRVFYLSTDQTWRWRYKVADRFHARFWNQLLSGVMQPPYSASDDYVALGTDKIEYDTGESSTVRVRLQDTTGKPVSDATVDALLVANDRVIATVPLSLDDPARGTYQGQTPPLDTGAYEIRIRASGFDAAALQATTPIWVGRQQTAESRRVSLDENALLQITEAGGGFYFHESTADTILQSLEPLSSGSIVESDILIWQSFYWFWAVIALLAIEWWMRKRAGLV